MSKKIIFCPECLVLSVSCPLSVFITSVCSLICDRIWEKGPLGAEHQFLVSHSSFKYSSWASYCTLFCVSSCFHCWDMRIWNLRFVLLIILCACATIWAHSGNCSSARSGPFSLILTRISPCVPAVHLWLSSSDFYLSWPASIGKQNLSLSTLIRKFQVCAFGEAHSRTHLRRNTLCMLTLLPLKGYNNMRKSKFLAEFESSFGTGQVLITH